MKEILSLPKGWEIKKLGEICQFINGRAYNKQELLNEGKYTVLRVGNFFTSDHWYYSDLELEENKYCDTGDLLYAWSASFGPKIWDGGKVIYHYHIWKVIPNKDLVTKEFLYHLLDWDKDQIKIDQGAGTTMTHVSKGSMEERLVNIPPLPEQQRIVSVLDEAFASIAQAKSNAERNLVNARELFESLLNEVFEKKDWEEKKLGDVIQLEYGKPLPHSKRKPNGKYPVYGANGEKNRSDEYYYDKPSIIVGRKGSAGEINLTEKKFWPLDVSYFVTFEDKKHDLRFLYYLLSKLGLTKLAKGVKPGINRNEIYSIRVKTPPLAEQRAIVGRLEALSAETGRLEEIYQSKLEALEELKKSVLQNAFSGELAS